MARRDIERQLKRVNPFVLVLWVVLFAGAVFGGYFTHKTITKNDCFKLLGKKEISIQIGSSFTYTDEGVKILSFGRDLKDKVEIETNLTKNDDGTYTLDTSEAGEYYMIYTVDDIKYGKIQRVRVFIVEEVANE